MRTRTPLAEEGFRFVERPDVAISRRVIAERLALTRFNAAYAAAMTDAQQSARELHVLVAGMLRVLGPSPATPVQP